MANSVFIFPGSYTVGSITVTGEVLAADGSASAPSYSFSGDSNTGWYRAGDATTGAVLRGAVNGSLVFTLDATGGLYLPLNTAGLTLGASSDVTLARLSAGTLTVGGNQAYGLAAKAWIRTAPTVTSAGDSPTVVASNGTAAFTVNVGTGGTATTIVIALPAATTGWIAKAENLTAAAANRANQTVKMLSSTTTSVTVQNQTVSTGAALAFTASDIVAFQCTAY